VLHIMLLPAILIATAGHPHGLLVVNKHTQFAGPGRTNDNVVGSPVMPVFAAKAGGFFFLVFGVIMLIASSSRSTRFGTTGPTTPPLCLRERNRTGISALPMVPEVGSAGLGVCALWLHLGDEHSGSPTWC
jgi:hypothetical protein